MKKPILVVSPSMPPFEEYVEEIRSIWETKHLTHQGPKHQELQKKLENYFNIDNVSLIVNGHVALEIALEALDLKGEVITTPFTFASTTQAILRCGLTPVFCDINENDFTIDVTKIEDLITEKTCAILPVHVYGNICDVEKIEEIAKKYNLKVIYDAAHAFGEEYKGRNISNYGDISMFSFHATKVFNTVEGGCLCYDDSSLIQKINSLKQFGQIVGTDDVPLIGSNAKMTEIHAAMGICNLNHIDEYIKRREKVVECYRHCLGNIEGIKISPIQPHVKNNYSYFPVIFEEEKLHISRDDIANILIANNIYPRKYFYPLTSDFECCKNLGISADVPIAQKISKEVLTLPCYSDLSVDDVKEICHIILNAISKDDKK